MRSARRQTTPSSTAGSPRPRILSPGRWTGRSPTPRSTPSWPRGWRGTAGSSRAWRRRSSTRRAGCPPTRPPRRKRARPCSSDFRAVDRSALDRPPGDADSLGPRPTPVRAGRRDAADPAALERSLAARQEALAEAALEAAGELSEKAGEGLEEALAEAAGEMQAGDPAAAAQAQDRAAAEMMQAAGQTRSEEGPQGPQTSHQAALDRAAGRCSWPSASAIAERRADRATRGAGARAARRGS
jgi:hypothetical protein